jgi:hypothetical protein
MRGSGFKRIGKDRVNHSFCALLLCVYVFFIEVIIHQFVMLHVKERGPLRELTKLITDCETIDVYLEVLPDAASSLTGTRPCKR